MDHILCHTYTIQIDTPEIGTLITAISAIQNVPFNLVIFSLYGCLAAAVEERQ